MYQSRHLRVCLRRCPLAGSEGDLESVTESVIVKVVLGEKALPVSPLQLVPYARVEVLRLRLVKLPVRLAVSPGGAGAPLALTVQPASHLLPADPRHGGQEEEEEEGDCLHVLV